MPSRKERLFEEIDVNYAYGNQDVQTDCIRVGLVDSLTTMLYLWGRGDAVAVRLDKAGLNRLSDQLCECLEIIAEREREEARSRKDSM